MPKGPVLTQVRRGEILGLDSCGLTQDEIAERMNCSQSLVSTFLKDPENYGSRSYALERRKITKRELRYLIRDGEAGEKSAQQIVLDRKLRISRRHASRLLRSEGGLKFGKPKRRLKRRYGALFLPLETENRH